MRLWVIVASVGRSEVLCQTIDRLADQTRPPDGIVVSVPGLEDVAAIDRARGNPDVIFAPKGLCAQRNAGLDVVEGKADIVIFFDDDFVAALDYLENVEILMAGDPEIAGLTGDLLADGIHGEPIPFAEAARICDEAEREGASPEGLRNRLALYGCNMAYASRAIEGRRFDEALPLYGWQEDIDFSHPLAKVGKLLSGPHLTGVHMGARGGRQPGLRLGYSQIANIVYLQRKGTMQPGLGRRLLVQNVVSNFARSFWPEKGIDRRGRLRGNMLGFADWVRGTIDPRRIERM